MSGDVYIVGIDMIKFGKFPDRSVESLGAEAALGALDDAGLTIRDMEALYCGNLMYASGMVGQRILREIGLTGIPVVNCANACATGATAFREGWIAIKAGLYDLVLAVGVEKMAGAGLLGGPRESGIPTEGLLGSGTMPCVFAEAGLEHSRKYGTTFEQFAKVAVKNHHHATMNPKARYQMETPFISAVVDLEGGGSVKGTLKNIAPDPDQVKLGMPVEVKYEIAPRKDREGNEYMTFFFEPRRS